MTTIFWVLEYAKVLFAYAFLFFIWPAVIFRKFLKNRSLTFQFGFCVTEQVILMNTVVLLLGLFHCLKAWLIWLLFFGSFLYCIYRAIPGKRRFLKLLKRLIQGTYGMKQFLMDAGKKCKKIRQRVQVAVRKSVNGRIWEFGVLCLVLLFGAIYFTYGAFQDYSFGFGDMYPHNAWIYGLTQGQIFSAGVYPEGMHCVLYLMHTLFGIRIYSCLLFTAGIHMVIFMLSAYILLKEVFRWKYTPILALTFFLTLDVVCINSIYSMSRLQWTLPQEFGLYTLFLCAAFLVRTLRKEREEIPFPTEGFWSKRKILKFMCYNEDLLIFSMAIAASLIIHFYPTIMAFFLCVAFVPVMIHKVLKPDRFVGLVVAAVLGFVVAVIPMAGALASGIPFQGSIGWAMDVINGTEGASDGNIILDENGQEITNLFGGKKDKDENKKTEESVAADSGNDGQDHTYIQSTDPSAAPAPSAPEEGVTAPEGDTPVEEAAPPAPKEPILTRIKNKCLHIYDVLYREAYVTLYRVERGGLFLFMTGVCLIIFLVLRVAATFGRYVLRREEIKANAYDNYLSLIFSTIIFMAMYCASSLGLPSLIAGSRLCSVIHLLLCAMCMIPVDALISLIAEILHRNLEKALGTILVFGIYFGTRITGNFHGYLYYELTRYNAAVMTTYYITENMPKYKYTIVSTVDELYQQIEYGFHEEAVNFVNECIASNYTIPTEYVFIYIEKHPLEYAQSHFFGGPDWLALEKYPSYYNSFVSQCPKITTATASLELARPPFFKYPVSSHAYSELLSRTVLESRLLSWCLQFDVLYPGELHTFYEDDNFVCYYFKQNPACLYQLGFKLEADSE